MQVELDRFLKLQVHWPKLLISIENISWNLTGNFFIGIASSSAQRSLGENLSRSLKTIEGIASPLAQRSLREMLSNKKPPTRLFF